METTAPRDGANHQRGGEAGIPHNSPTPAENQVLTPDYDQARHHLMLLDEEAEIHVFQSFDDSKAKREHLARTISGNFEQCKNELTRLNRQGAGVFVTVNKSRNGRRKLEDITEARAVFREADVPGLEQLPVEPHLIVGTSPGKYHEYLFIEPTDDLDTWNRIMTTMVQDHGSDPNAKDQTRVLRLAGFYHQKAEPHMVKITHESGAPPYTLAEVAQHIPPAEKPADRPQTAKNGTAYAQAALGAELATLAGTPEGSRNDQLNRSAFSMGQIVAGGQIDQGQVEVALMAAANGIGLSETEARATIKSGISRGMDHPRTAKTAKTATANSEEWKKPEPFIELEASRPYPLAALPDEIRQAVEEVVGVVQCPPALAVASALAAVSTVVQGVADVRRANGLQGPSGDYFLSQADSGERKSTVDGYFSDPIRTWEAEQMEAVKPDLAQYDAAISAWEAEKAGIVSAIKGEAKKGSSTEELKAKLADIEAKAPVKPIIPRLLYTDATPEALAYGLHKYPTGGLLSAEAGIVFGGHAMGKDSQMRNLALLNCLWSGEQYRPDRRTSKGFILRSARLTIGLAVQPETLRAFLDGSAGLARGIGFLARFLISCPESTQGSRKFKEPPEAWPYLSKFHRRLSDLLEVALPLDQNGDLAPALIDLDREAKQLWVKFHDDIEEELAPGREMEEARDVASKTADHAARLACQFHVFSNGPAGCISPEHMRAGAQIAAWHLYEARRFMREIAVPETINLASKLNDWLVARAKQNGCQEITTTEIQKYGPGPLRKKAALEPVLAELEKASRIRMDGQTARINPNLLEV